MSGLSFKYVRIQGKELARNTMYAKGIFSMCWQLIQQDVMDQEDADLFREIDGWFADPRPDYLLPQWVLDEVTKVSYRPYCTGFFFDDPHDNAQISFAGGYTRDWDVMAVVETWENGVACRTQRNRFFTGDTLEVLAPDIVPFSVTPQALYNADGEQVEATNHPMMAFSFPCEQPLPKGAFLRKERTEK